MIQALLAITLTQAAITDAQLDAAVLKLGQARADFGYDHEAEPQWRVEWMGEVNSTIIMFPEGRADTRYFFGQVLFGDEQTWVLCSQSKVGSKVVKDWWVKLVPITKERSNPYTGTLGKLCAAHDITPKYRSKRIDAALNARKGFAMYKVLYIGLLDNRYLAEDGGHYQSDKDDMIDLEKHRFLGGGPPYPISRFERNRLRMIFERGIKSKGA